MPPFLQLSGASDTTPMIAGIVSAVAGAVLIGLGLWLWRRRSGHKSRTMHQPGPTTIRNSDHDPGLEPSTFTGPGLAVIRDNGGQHRPYQHTTLPPPHQRVDAPPSYHDAVAAEEADPFASSLGGDRGRSSLAPGIKRAQEFPAGQSLTATTSTANMSTAERADVLPVYEGQRVARAAPAGADGVGFDSSSASDRRGSRGGIGLGEAVMEAAENLAYHCQIPGVSEAASVVSTLVKLVSDSRDISSGGDSNLRQCRSIVRTLERASTVAGRVSLRCSPLLHGSVFWLECLDALCNFSAEGHDVASENSAPKESAC